MEIQNVPPQPQPTEVVISPTKSKLPIFLITGVFLLLFVVGATSYYLGTKQIKSSSIIISPTQVPTPTITSHPTQTMTITDKFNNWKTYINSQNNFQIKYPNDKNAFVKEGGYIGFCNIGKGESEIRIYSENYVTPIPPIVEADFSGKLIVVIAKKQKGLNQTVNNWVTQSCPTFLEKNIIKQPIIINGNQGVKFISKYKESEFGAAAYDFIIVPKDNDFYLIYGLAYSDKDIENLFEPILNSFSFTK